jgi:hypothetical protein
MERPQDHHEEDVAPREADGMDEPDRTADGESMSYDPNHRTATATAERDRMDSDEREPASYYPTPRATGTATADRDAQPDAEDQQAAPNEQTAESEDRDAGGIAVAGAPRTVERFELFTTGDVEGYRRRWETLQAGFVDDPRGSAEQAGALLEEAVEHVSRRSRELRDDFGRQTGQGGDTEAMRLALRQYREFFAILVGA